MPQITPLFDDADLGAWLKQPVAPETADLVERVVWGWLQPLLAVEDRPDPAPDWLVSAAIELGAIAYANPEGLAEYKLEKEWSLYSSERREAILRTVASRGVTPDGLTAVPRGSFPPAPCYPDPADRRRPDRPWI